MRLVARACGWRCGWDGPHRHGTSGVPGHAHATQQLIAAAPVRAPGSCPVQEIPAVRIVEKILYAADSGAPSWGAHACLPAVLHRAPAASPARRTPTNPPPSTTTPAAEAKEAMAEAQAVYNATFEAPAEQPADEVAAQ